MLKKLLMTGALLVGSLLSTTNAQTYEAITPPVAPIYDPSKIEVVEIFSYACPACYMFEGYFEPWREAQKNVDDVEVITLASPGQALWTLYAQAFYTLEAIDELDKGHEAFFKAIHQDKQRFINENQIADFMATQGIDKEKFLKAWNSFSAKSSFNRAADLIGNQYRVNFTPAIVVDGRYLLSANSANNRPGNENAYEKLILTINDVVEKVRQERKAQAAPTTSTNMASPQEIETGTETITVTE